MTQLLATLTFLLGASVFAAEDASTNDAPVAAAEPAVVPDDKKLSPDDCVAIALGESGLVGEADGKVDEWKGRLAEVQANLYPKLFGRGFAAPMFRVNGDPSTVIGALDVDRDYGQWGPYFHLEATLAQPLYTFGRVAAGKRAAENRVKVEQARARQVRNTLALEVRKMYFLHLFAKSMIPTLQNARKLLDGALEQAQKLFDEGTGKVTQTDLQKLIYGSAELDKYLIQAEMGAALSLEGLKQVMGLPPTANIVVRDEQLPVAPTDPLPTYEKLLELAMQFRPEWEQVSFGKVAARELEKSERLSSLPFVFAAGQFGADWTPMRPDIKNPFYYDPYNGLSGGVAVGLQFDVDVAKTMAKTDQAVALVKQVESLERFAASGIPTEVRKAYSDALQAQRTLAVTNKGSVAARKWMVFAGAAYSAGTGEARDVLEGLAAYVQSRKSYFETLQGLHTSLAFVTYVTGRTGVEDRAPAKAGQAPLTSEGGR